MREQNYSARRPGEGFLNIALGIIILAALSVGIWQLYRTGFFAPPQVRTQPAQQPPVVAPPVAAPPIQAQPVPVEHVVEYQPAPPAEVAPEEVQPRTEVVNVQRAPEQTTIVRTVPQKPAGPPIVIDKGVKRRGAP